MWMLERMGALRDVCVFFFNDTATTEIYTLSLHDALPISTHRSAVVAGTGAMTGPASTTGIGASTGMSRAATIGIGASIGGSTSIDDERDRPGNGASTGSSSTREEWNSPVSRTADTIHIEAASRECETILGQPIPASSAKLMS